MLWVGHIIIICMPQRLDEFNKKFVYTNTNPENIISGRKNALFSREGNNFFFNAGGNASGTWTKLPYRTVIIPPPPLTKLIEYEHASEMWLKTTDGFYDRYNKLMPKTGWQFLSYTDATAEFVTDKVVRWTFPVPTNSNDAVGVENSRSYDENYFYAKVGGKWLRAPITLFTEAGASTADNPYWNVNLPFVDDPRYLPVPPNSSYPANLTGDQSYDLDFFYIKASQWKRSPLFIYDIVNKMAQF